MFVLILNCQDHKPNVINHQKLEHVLFSSIHIPTLLNFHKVLTKRYQGGDIPPVFEWLALSRGRLPFKNLAKKIRFSVDDWIFCFFFH